MFAHPKMLAGQYFHTVFSIDWLELISRGNVYRFNKLLLISRFVDNNIDKRTLSGSLVRSLCTLQSFALYFNRLIYCKLVKISLNII